MPVEKGREGVHLRERGLLKAGALEEGDRLGAAEGPVAVQVGDREPLADPRSVRPHPWREDRRDRARRGKFPRRVGERSIRWSTRSSCGRGARTENLRGGGSAGKRGDSAAWSGEPFGPDGSGKPYLYRTTGSGGRADETRGRTGTVTRTALLDDAQHAQHGIPCCCLCAPAGFSRAPRIPLGTEDRSSNSSNGRSNRGLPSEVRPTPGR